MAALNYSDVSKLLKADFETGKLFWLPRPADMFKSERYAHWWNGRYSGKPAGTPSSGGYLRVTFKEFRTSAPAHRIVWLLAYGNWPNDQLDHINGNPSDNRLANLREVTNLENGKNQKTSTRNTSGVRGVSWHKPTERWQAQIYVDGKWRALGYHHEFERAVWIRKQAEAYHGFHPNHGR